MKAINLHSIYKYLNKEFKLFSYNQQFNGLLIRGINRIKKIGFAVNTSFEVIQTAINYEINLLIVHHPPFLSENIDLYKNKIKLLKKHKINLIALHEALDCHPVWGTSAVLSKLLNLKINGEFSNKDGLPVGLITTNNDRNLLKKLEKFNLIEKLISNHYYKKIAIAAGYNGKPYMIYQAKIKGCDTFITGETHMFGRLYAKESLINLICLGHYESEYFAIDNLMKIIKEKFNITTIFIKESHQFL